MWKGKGKRVDAARRQRDAAKPAGNIPASGTQAAQALRQARECAKTAGQQLCPGQLVSKARFINQKSRWRNQYVREQLFYL